MADWCYDADATRAACRFFKGDRAVVQRNGRQLLITGTPAGRLELLPFGHLMLAAAENPPHGITERILEHLPSAIIGHCERHGLRPWKVLQRDDRLGKVLGRLWDDHASVQDSRAPLWSPLLHYLPSRPLVGESRHELCDQVGAVLKARRECMPLPLLWGPGGVGRRTLLGEVAARFCLTGIELPLGRLLSSRVFQSASEACMDFLLEARPELDKVLLAVSGAEWICSMSSPFDRRWFLDELGRLPHVVLLTDQQLQLATGDRCVILACRGLTIAQSAELLAVECPRCSVSRPVLEMMARIASLPDVGVVPARLVFLARLAESILGASAAGERRELHPDDVAPAIATVAETWNRRTATGEGLPGQFWSEA